VQSVTKVKPIKMSLDISTTVEPSQFRHGEGCQDGTRANPVKSGRGPNDDWSDHHHGGVGGHGMQVQVGGVRNEIFAGGRQRPAAGTSGQTHKARLADGEVGAVPSRTVEGVERSKGSGCGTVEGVRLRKLIL
jgi:hypothetical protein